MNNICPPPKVLNPRTGKCVAEAYLKKLNNKKALKEQINDNAEVVEVPEVPKVPEVAKVKPNKVKIAKTAIKATDYKQSIIENLKI